MTSAGTTGTFCYNHPQRETLLRCNRCERPICTDCAVLTPTGYRCRECVRSQQKVFETAVWLDYPLAVMIAGGLAFAGSLVVGLLGFFTILLAPVAGVVIAEVVRRVTRRRRSRLLFQLTAAAAALGGGLLLLTNLAGLLLAASLGGVGAAGWGLLGLVWQGIYAAIVTSTVYARLSGLQLGR